MTVITSPLAAGLHKELASVPATLLSAHRLHGALEYCGLGYRSVATAEDATVRAQSLQAFIPAHTVVAGLTAAWVWGCVKQLHLPLEVNDFGGVCRLPAGLHERVQVAHARLTVHEIIQLDTVRITTPTRTMFDLLYQQPLEVATTLTPMLKELMHISNYSITMVFETLTSRQHPMKKRALRIAEIALQPHSKIHR